jgi:hypothetical protein
VPLFVFLYSHTVLKAEPGHPHENSRIRENVIIPKPCPQYENAQMSSEGWCMWFVIPTATGIEGERERERVCVCVCGCKRGQNIVMQSVLGPCGSNSTVASS